MRIGLGLAVLVIALGYYKFWQITRPLPLPKLDDTEYWGPGKKSAYRENKLIDRFEIFYDEETIATLKRKLNEPYPLHPPLEGIEHEYGISSVVLTDLVKYWRTDYLSRWSERQQLFNSVPHFKTKIQG